MGATPDPAVRTRDWLRGALWAAAFLPCLAMLSSYLLHGMFALMAQTVQGTHIAVLLALTAVVAGAAIIAVLAVGATLLRRR